MSTPSTPAARGDAPAAAPRRRSILSGSTLPVGGMVASIGTLVLTGLVRHKGWKGLHVAAGAVLVGTALWHATQQARYARMAQAKKAADEKTAPAAKAPPRKKAPTTRKTATRKTTTRKTAAGKKTPAKAAGNEDA